MIKAKEMRKLAKRWMEDHEPARVKAASRRSTAGLVFALVGSLPMLVTVFQMSQGVGGTTTFAAFYGARESALIFFGAFSSMVLGSCLWVYLSSFDPVNLVDYYFERVYEGEWTKGPPGVQ